MTIKYFPLIQYVFKKKRIMWGDRLLAPCLTIGLSACLIDKWLRHQTVACEVLVGNPTAQAVNTLLVKTFMQKPL